MTPLQLVAELRDRADPLTLLTLLAFWVRWELWRRTHQKHHAELHQLIPHPAGVPHV